ncbi:MAG: hypothetical protein ABIY55_11870 [Kofleriaceae bacterium]
MLAALVPVFSEPPRPRKGNERKSNPFRERAMGLPPLAPTTRVVLRTRRTHGVAGRRLLTNPPPTPIVPPERRAGIYENDDDVTGLLWYGTHAILDVPRDRPRTTAGTASDRDLVLVGDGISARHLVMERRARGLYVTDDGSTNGLADAVKRDLGLALKPSFEDRRDTGDGFALAPGMTFVVGAESNRLVALDDAMRVHHPRLVEILGREDEIRSASEGSETPSPSDLILAADGPGHLLITSKPGCEEDELARVIHKISKRRRQPLVEMDQVPDDRRGQNAILKQKATKGTLVLHLGANRKRLDPVFVSAMFSPGYQIRVVVVARTPNQARRALGHQHWRPLMHIALSPVALRRSAIYRLLDQWLASRGSVLRMVDLTPHNQRALLHNAWRDNLRALREAAVRLDAIAVAGFSRKRAAEDLGIVRQTFYNWFNSTMKLTKPLVPDARKRELMAVLASRARAPA